MFRYKIAVTVALLTLLIAAAPASAELIVVAHGDKLDIDGSIAPAGTTSGKLWLFGNKDILDPIFEGENDSFEDWWNMYNKKRGKKKAKQKWDRLTEAQQIACLNATPAYVASTPDPVYRKDPLTYLNGECWNDEIIQKQNNEQQRAINLTAKAARIIGSDYQG